jgi:hypothetical protein
MGRARDLANILSSSGNVALDSELGLSLITPTSITATGGSGSISATGAVTFTSASAISLNNVFSATYNNYKIILTTTSRVTASVVSMRLRSSTTDNSSTNYNGSVIQKPTNSSTISGYNASNSTGFEVGSIQTYGGVSRIDLFDPQTSNYTTYHSVCQSKEGAVNTSQYIDINSGSMSVTTSYDGVTFFGNLGTITGTIRVYGYRN